MSGVWSKSNKQRKIEIKIRRSVWLALSLVFICSCLLGVASAVKAAEQEAQAAQQQQPWPPYACDTSSNYRFCNTSISIRERATDLVSRLTLDEKVSQLVNDAAAIPRLGVPAYEWWSEALHGVADAGPGVSFNGTIKAATSFPQIILTAATFDSHLWFRIAQAIGIEARAVYNEGQAKGMTFWAPNINIFRDPRWGRGQETPGEDPLVAGKYAVSYVRGVQGDSFDGSGLRDHQPEGAHLQASACCKHFTAYDLDRWKNVTRYAFDAQVSAQDMADTYQPPFQSCIQEGRASGIMCAYNRVNGIPACADYSLLTDTARGKWDFNGYITSDCDAVSIIHDVQGYAKTPEDAVSDVLKAGMDVNCGSYLKNHTKSAVLMNKVPEAAVDRALENLFSIRIRLGLFDGNPKRLMFGDIGPNHVCTKEHQDLALEAAQNGIVLLKNNAKLLPLPDKDIQKTNSNNISTASSVLAVIGPNANSSKVLLGNYHGPPCMSISPLQALQQRYASSNNNVLIKYHPGCHDSVACSSASIEVAVDIAKGADYVVLIMGLDQTQEREDYDRQNVLLPGKQQDLITQVARAAKNPVVLVVMCGGPVDISFAKGDNKVGGIIWAGYPGQAGGVALAQIIFGDHNPGGKLPVTWYPQDFVNSVSMTDMRMRSDPALGYPGRTYRFYKGPTVFEFGHGLSYSTYSYEFLVAAAPHNIHLKSIGAQVKVARKDDRYASSTYKRRFALISEMTMIKGLCEKLKFSVSIIVRNHGVMDGKHLVLLYVRWQEDHGTSANGGATDRPIKQLIGFRGASVKSKQEAHVEFTLSPCQHMSRANRDGLMVMEEVQSSFDFSCNGSSSSSFKFDLIEHRLSSMACPRPLFDFLVNQEGGIMCIFIYRR